MRHLRRQEEEWGLKMTAHDGAVILVGAVAASPDSWWRVIVDPLPDALRVIVVGATVVYVLFRAMNEINKFIQNHRDRRNDS